MSRTLRAALALLLLAGVAACDKDATKISGDPPFKFAVVGPMTGPLTKYGGQLRYGVEQAMEDINRRGGMLDRQLTLRPVDDHCDPKQAMAIARGLAMEKITFVVGHACSAATIAAAPVYSDANILMIVPSASDPALTDEAAARGAKNIFRTMPRNDLQGVALAKHILGHYQGAAVALIQDGTSYGGTIMRATAAALQASGVRPVLEETTASETRDFSSLVAKLKAANIGVIVFGGGYKPAALLLRETRRQGLAAAFGGGDSLIAKEFWSVAGSAGEGTFMAGLPDPRNILTAQNAATGLANYGIDVTGYTLYAYAAVQTFAEAAEHVHSVSTPAVAKALREGEYDTVLGRIGFDAKGDVRGLGYRIYAWHDGEYRGF